MLCYKGWRSPWEEERLTLQKLDRPQEAGRAFTAVGSSAGELAVLSASSRGVSQRSFRRRERCTSRCTVKGDASGRLSPAQGPLLFTRMKIF